MALKASRQWRYIQRQGHRNRWGMVPPPTNDQPHTTEDTDPSPQRAIASVQPP